MTYRQAKNFGLPAYQPDALIDRVDAADMNDEVRRERLTRTLKLSGLTEVVDAGTIAQEQIDGMDNRLCIFLEGEDSRIDLPTVARSLDDELGANVRSTLPGEGNMFWIESRLIKYFTGDFRESRDYRGLSIKGEPPTPLMKSPSNQWRPEASDFAIQQAARVLARATAIPCIALLEGGSIEENANEISKRLPGEPPGLYDCVLMGGLIGYDRFQ